jgi:predicted GTPase
LDHFNVLKKDVNFAIWDIPGLNDARTKNIYFEFINDNFIKFDVVIFMVDIKSALNTSDEMDILNMIITNIKTSKVKGKDVKLLVVTNKCDDMEMDEGHIIRCIYM